MNTRNRANQFPEDQWLRNAGWRIYERPRTGQALWLHWSGIVLTTAEAIAHEREKCLEFAAHCPAE